MLLRSYKHCSISNLHILLTVIVHAICQKDSPNYRQHNVSHREFPVVMMIGTSFWSNRARRRKKKRSHRGITNATVVPRGI
jgi:hypothetical protein